MLDLPLDAARSRFTSPHDINIMDPAFVADPWAAYEVMRKDTPVWWCEAASAWVVTRYEDVRSILANPSAFSSVPRPARPYLELPGYEDPESLMILLTDDPRHKTIRRMLTENGAYSKRSMQEMRADLGVFVEKLVDALADDRFDVMSDLVFPAAAEMMQRFFDLPKPRAGEADWAQALPRFYVPGLSRVETLNLLGYLLRVIDERRSSPGDDPISASIIHNEKSKLLSDEQMAWNYFDPLMAGGASMAAFVGFAILGLAQHPSAQGKEFWDSVLSSESSVEELLRWVGHIHFIVRTANEDINFGGQSIKEGQTVAVVVVSANRDESIWERSGELDLARKQPLPNLAMGYGKHVATGYNMVRMFAALLIPILLRKRGQFRVVGSPVTGQTRSITVPHSIVLQAI
jgi:cytochrome P450